MSLIIGIDPGLTGAVAFMDRGHVDAVHDMPTLPRPAGKGNQVSAELLAHCLRMFATNDSHVVIEQVNAMPKQGVTSSFNFGRSLGIVEGAVAMTGCPMTMVRPAVWKKALGLTGKEKGASIALAARLHPEAAEWLTLKKYDGRAEAILLAHWLMKQETGL